MLITTNVFLKASDIIAKPSICAESVRKTARSFNTFPVVNRQFGRAGANKAEIHNGDGVRASATDTPSAQSEGSESAPDITSSQIPNNVSTALHEAACQRFKPYNKTGTSLINTAST